MSLRSYILLMLLATVLCFLGFLSVIFLFDPIVSKSLAKVFFFTSLFLTLVGFFSILGLLVRLFLTKEKLVFKKVTTSFRQAIWFSLLIIICLFLKSYDVFMLRNLILLIAILTFFEVAFISYKSKPSLKI